MKLIDKQREALKALMGDLSLLDDTPEIIEGMQQNRVDSSGKYNYWVGEAQVNLIAYFKAYKKLKKLLEQ